jgi:4-hydroxy-tetrahydrodipicolinate synthase
VRTALGLEPLTLYCGDDSLLLGFLSVGASGIITVAGHIIGQQFSQIINQFNQGNSGIKVAQNLFNSVSWAIDLLNGTGQQAACTKAALQALNIISEREMRLPNIALNELEYQELAAVIQSHNNKESNATAI